MSGSMLRDKPDTSKVLHASCIDKARNERRHWLENSQSEWNTSEGRDF